MFLFQFFADKMDDAARKKLNLEKASNFMRQYRDPTSRELKKLSANQFMEVWSHYDKDGKHFHPSPLALAFLAEDGAPYLWASLASMELLRGKRGPRFDYRRDRNFFNAVFCPGLSAGVIRPTFCADKWIGNLKKPPKFQPSLLPAKILGNGLHLYVQCALRCVSDAPEWVK